MAMGAVAFGMLMAAGFVGLLGQVGFALIPLLQRPRGARA